MAQRYPRAPRRKRARSLRSITRADGWAQDPDFDFWPRRWDHPGRPRRRVRRHAAVGGRDRRRGAARPPPRRPQAGDVREARGRGPDRRPRDLGAARRLERTVAERGLEPRNAFICTEMAAVRGLASKGLGVAVMPRSVAEQPGPPFELRPIGPERLTWPIALVWRAARRQSPAGKAFLKVALDYAEKTDVAPSPALRAA